MTRATVLRVTLGAILLLELCACSKFMGGLRRDLDDGENNGPPTTGGLYPEHGFLSQDMSEGGPYADRYSSIGHSERNPASVGSTDPDQQSWISPDQAAANRRDAYRGIEPSDDPETADSSFSSNPNLAPPVQRQYKNGARATRADFVDDSQNEGSLWASGGQTNYYFTKNKVRSVGDIVTLKIEKDLFDNIATEVRRGLTPGERDREIAVAQERLNHDAAAPAKDDALASSAAAPDRAPASDGSANGNGGQAKSAAPSEPREAVATDIDVSKSLAIKVDDTMMAEIVERYPNGNYKIRATKRIPYKNGSPRLMSLVGIARGSDIGDDDTVGSGKLYEYRVEALR